MAKEKAFKIDYIDKQGFYVIENYDKKLPFASFLAGIAGVEGIPMWSFYVNRGQGMSSIGIRDKDNCIMEFFPANEAYKMIYSNGFRTFIKIIDGKHQFIFEPFSVSTNDKIKRTMKIKNNELKLIEFNEEVNLNIEVTYFTIPNEEFSALGRKIKVENISDKDINYEILDGLTAILPYGSQNSAYKEISNTLRSWMQGEVNEDNIAMYKVRSTTGDTTKVDEVKNSYFYMSFDETEKLLNPIVDKENIFGFDTSLKQPIEFEKNDIESITNKKDICYNKVPCGFSGKKVKLHSNETSSIFSYIGYTNDSEGVNKLVDKICHQEYFASKIEESNELIEQISKHVETNTSYPLFDNYIKQCYIDNVLRGGYPIELGNTDKKIYYIYSRKHGDLERDYNFFSIEPNYYSQGNGNFRDVNQNRRMDVYVHPFTGTENIKLFNNLIQLDGYNPLVIKGKVFYINRDDKKKVLELLNVKENEKLEHILNNKFTVGQLYSVLKNIQEIEAVKVNELMNEIIEISEEEIDSDFGEGFWTDHWTYNLDLIEEYLSVYPDKIRNLLFKDDDYKFFNSPEYVLPRSDKYVLDNGEVRQYKALEKKEELDSKWVKDAEGDLVTTNLFTKLFMLAGIKFMTLDPMGFGIEMEAGKPGWNDAMNGLPGIIGSSFAETAELKRLLLFIKEHINLVGNSIDIPNEFNEALTEMDIALTQNLDKELEQFIYWDKVSSIREEYREKIKYYISGENSSLQKQYINTIINKMISKIDLGIEKLKSINDNKIPTFMHYDVTKYDIDDEKGIKPLEFEVKFLPLFLEGPARYLKTGIKKEEKSDIYNFIKNSDVYDKKLKMYKTSESLEDVSFKIGRSRSFTAGWLERESIFMHMEYKYILELIRNGLYEEFLDEIKNVLPPFMKPEVYGRSVLENSSFIASSSNPDERTHGRGFVARLSGTTVEMLNIWKLMMVGKNIFSYEEDTLKFKLQPILSKDFFNESMLTTTLLGKTKLVYKNVNNKNTYGEQSGVIKQMVLIDKENNILEIEGNEVSGEVAESIRNGQIVEIQATIV